MNMKRAWWQLGEHVVIEITGKAVNSIIFKDIFDFLDYVENNFSLNKYTSEISKFYNGQLGFSDLSPDAQKILEYADPKSEFYFDLVKAWAVEQISQKLIDLKIRNFYISLGYFIKVLGKDKKKKEWKINIRLPFNHYQTAKVLQSTKLSAVTKELENSDIMSITVVGQEILEAVKLLSLAIPKGLEGMGIISSQKKYEGMVIDKTGLATMTKGFKKLEADET